MKVAVVGVTGVVGTVLLKLLEEREFPVSEIIPVASEKSVGNKIMFKGKDYKIVSLDDAVNMKPDIALFSAGGSISLEWAPKFAKEGTRVVDNSSAWRMDSTKKLIVSEVNSKVLTKEDFIIANPNCSTMQMLVVLAPLHKKYKIKRLVISTYQSVSGTGKNAIDQLEGERDGVNSSKVYPYSIDQNLLPHCDIFEILSDSPGLVVEDDPDNNKYPMPINSANKDEVFVGRIRRDFSIKSGINLWIVADNLRKGAATNTIQIAEKLIELKIV